MIIVYEQKGGISPLHLVLAIRKRTARFCSDKGTVLNKQAGAGKAINTCDNPAALTMYISSKNETQHYETQKNVLTVYGVEYIRKIITTRFHFSLTLAEAGYSESK